MTDVSQKPCISLYTGAFQYTPNIQTLHRMTLLTQFPFLHLLLPRGVFPYSFHFNTFYAFPTHPILATCRHHSTLLDFTTLTFHTAVASSLIGENIPPPQKFVVNKPGYICKATKAVH